MSKHDDIDNIHHIRKDLMTSAKYGQDCENTLFIGYRSYITRIALETYESKGLSKEYLIKLQKKYDIVYPWDNEYELIRQDVNRKFVKFPLMIVMCNSEKDAQWALRFATKYNFEFCVRAGGHSNEGYSICSGIVIDQSRRDKVKINKKYNIAYVEPGALLGPIAYKLSKYGLALPTGTCANTGLGLVLGGGQGFLSRPYGLTCDSLLEIDVILANGKIVTANKESNEDLFWAYRGGGGGNFGIVTSYVFKVYPIKKVTIFEISYPYNSFKQVFSLWQSFAPFADVNLSTELSFTAANKDEPLLFAGVYVGKKKSLEQLLEPFLQIGTPQVMIKRTTYIDSMKHFAGKVVSPPFSKAKSHIVYSPINQEGIDAIYDNMQQNTSNRMGFYTLGGRIASIPVDETAFVHRKAQYWIQYVSYWNEQSDEKEKIAKLTELYNTVAPYVSNHGYVNMIDKDIIDYMNYYYGKHSDKLIQIKTKYDPTNLFKFAQSIPINI